MKATTHGIVIIPELEEAAQAYKQRVWSDEEAAIIKTYFGRVPQTVIYGYIKENFPPGRSLISIIKKAKKLGVGTRADRKTAE